jgi:hypothetical protein
MYLTDVEEGGETIFPDVPKLPHQTAANGWTSCGMMVSTRAAHACMGWPALELVGLSLPPCYQAVAVAAAAAESADCMPACLQVPCNTIKHKLQASQLAGFDDVARH